VTGRKACYSWDCIVTIHDCRVTYAEPAERVSQNHWRGVRVGMMQAADQDHSV